MHWDMTAILVPLAFWTFLAAVILVPIYLRSSERRSFYQAVRSAYERGAPVAPDLLNAMKAAAPSGSDIPSAERDFRWGVMLLAAGLGLVGLGAGLWYGLMDVDDISAWTSGAWAAGLGGIFILVSFVHFGFWLARRGRDSLRSTPLSEISRHPS